MKSPHGRWRCVIHLVADLCGRLVREVLLYDNRIIGKAFRFVYNSGASSEFWSQLKLTAAAIKSRVILFLSSAQNTVVFTCTGSPDIGSASPGPR